MPSFKPLVRSESLAQQAYVSIRRAIREGRIARGELFSETTFAKSLGVSRTPVREALLDLFRDGIVEIVPKRGFRLVELDDAAIDEIRMLRTALEQLVVERLCETATKEDLGELRNIASGKGRTRDDMFGLDETLHMRMAELAGLPQVRRVLLGVRGKMYLIASGARITKLRNEMVMKEHNEILDLIAKRSAAAARKAMTEHIKKSIDAFLAAREPRSAPQQYAEQPS
jgi:GntR family transcriptional regulator, rspAB operon transcriptional repressor